MSSCADLLSNFPFGTWSDANPSPNITFLKTTFCIQILFVIKLFCISNSLFLLLHSEPDLLLIIDSVSDKHALTSAIVSVDFYCYWCCYYSLLLIITLCRRKMSFCTGQPWNMIGRLIFVQVKVTFCISENSLYWLVRCSITLKTRATGAKESCDVARWECWYLSTKFCINKTHSLTRSNNEVFIYFWTHHLCVKTWLVHLHKLHKFKSASGSLFHAWNPYG